MDLLKFECKSCLDSQLGGNQDLKIQENKSSLIENKGVIEHFEREKLKKATLESDQYKINYKKKSKIDPVFQMKRDNCDPLIFKKIENKLNGSFSPLLPKQTNQDLQRNQRIKRENKIKEFLGHSRELPNTSACSIFGLPIWESYGLENRVTKHGGIIYGDYMMTHNINPHIGANHPEYLQSYNGALEKTYLRHPLPEDDSGLANFREIPLENRRNLQYYQNIYPRKNDFPGQGYIIIKEYNVLMMIIFRNSRTQFVWLIEIERIMQSKGYGNFEKILKEIKKHEAVV